MLGRLVGCSSRGGQHCFASLPETRLAAGINPPNGCPKTEGLKLKAVFFFFFSCRKADPEDNHSGAKSGKTVIVSPPFTTSKVLMGNNVYMEQKIGFENRGSD